MGELLKQVQKTLLTAQKELTETGRRMMADGDEDFNERNLVYEAMADLSVIVSRVLYQDCPEVHTGPVEVDNEQSMVIIDGIELRGDVQFEILDKGCWICGHREDNRYGQVLAGKGIILFNQIEGRVILPLRHDR